MWPAIKCYIAGYSNTHKVIKWFWRAVVEFTNEQKLRLLQVRPHPQYYVMWCVVMDTSVPLKHCSYKLHTLIRHFFCSLLLARLVFHLRVSKPWGDLGLSRGLPLTHWNHHVLYQCERVCVYNPGQLTNYMYFSSYYYYYVQLNSIATCKCMQCVA